MYYKKIHKNNFPPIRLIKNLMYLDAIILMYHRVAELDADPWSMAVTPKHFAEQMEIIRNYGVPTSLQHLRKNLQDEKLVQRTIVVTFDDGYRDNLNIAKPILEKYSIPATVFVVTSFIDQKHGFWWDELERLLLQSGDLPDTIELNIEGKNYKLQSDKSAEYSAASYKRFGNWCVKKKREEILNRRYDFYLKVYKLMQFLPDHERDQALKQISLIIDYKTSNRSINLSLTSSDLIRLEEGGLIEVGAHTISHPHLSRMAFNIKKDEIQSSKNYLENILGHKVDSFAYPHGSYDRNTISLVKESGFNCACSSIFGRIKRNNNLYLLPRVNIKDCDGESFQRWLSRIAWQST
jgi:peptidoglycan/xylan/chitin deacetylase (PgdA/CDA1 family)